MHIREQFAESLDLEGLRIINFPSFIFLCGGPYKNNGPPFLSVRHFIRNHIQTHHPELANNLLLAETLNDWFRGGYYESLLEFEEDMAGLAACVPIFLESPGSIAELSAFCKTSVRSKLLVFVQNEHYSSQSFIKFGPLTDIENEFQTSVHVYPWKQQKNRLNIDSINQHADEICESIRRKVREIPEEAKFNNKIAAHKLLLICDIIDLFGVAINKDITYLLKRHNISEEKEFKKYKFILQRMGLIEERALGEDRYLVATKPAKFIRYSFLRDAYASDILRWKIIIRDWIKKNDSKRLKIRRTIEVPA